MPKPILFLFAVLLALAAPFAYADDSPDPAKAAEDWLALVDSGKYSESWDSAAMYFRNAIRKEAWQDSLRGARHPLGEVVSRKAVKMEYKKTLPGAPEGEYVVIEYKTSFEKKGGATETVTPMKDWDGVWRVSGYYIR